MQQCGRSARGGGTPEAAAHGGIAIHEAAELGNAQRFQLRLIGERAPRHRAMRPQAFLVQGLCYTVRYVAGQGCRPTSRGIRVDVTSS